MRVEETVAGEAGRPVEVECCPHCGSVGIVHFSDSFHRCLKCLEVWQGCWVAIGHTPTERIRPKLRRER